MGAPEERKHFFFEKKKQKTFISFGPVAVKQARSKLTKFFLLLFCSQKRRLFFFLALRHEMPAFARVGRVKRLA
jgi:hypothetical protein